MKRTTYPTIDPSIIDDDNQRFGLPDISIPAEVLFNPNLTLTQKVLFGFIRNLAQTEKGCWASNKYLAKCVGVEKQTITNSVGKLKELYYIKVEYRTLANGVQGRRIFIDERYPAIYSKYIRQVYKNINNGILTRIYPPISTIIPPYNQINGNTNNKINIKDYSSEAAVLKKDSSNGYITSGDFEEFWKLYPSHRRGSKGEALTKWETACHSPHRPTMNRVRRALKKQINSDQWQSDKGKYIPLARTWIHQKRWLDDPSQMKNWSNEEDNQIRREKEANEAEWRRHMGYDKDED